MHKELYEGLNFNSMQEYINYLQSFPQTELRWFETHGDWFADQVLVPTKQLEKHCVELLQSNRDQFSTGAHLSPEFWSYASNALAESFEVNPIVIEIRIQKESLASKYRDFYLR
jgi:hypothetical protein